MTPKDKRSVKLDKTLDNKYTLTFTKAELIFIFNVLLSREYKLGDAAIGFPVIKRIEPLIVVDSNIENPDPALTLTEEKKN